MNKLFMIFFLEFDINGFIDFFFIVCAVTVCVKKSLVSCCFQKWFLRILKYFVAVLMSGLKLKICLIILDTSFFSENMNILQAPLGTRTYTAKYKQMD